MPLNEKSTIYSPHMLDDMFDSGTRRDVMPIPAFTVEIPKGDDYVRVTLKELSFALIPEQNGGMHLFDDLRKEVEIASNNPNAGITAEEIMEKITFSLEVPPMNVKGDSNGIFQGKAPAFVKASAATLRHYVDDTIDTEQTDAIIAAAKHKLLAAAKKWNAARSIH